MDNSCTSTKDVVMKYRDGMDSANLVIDRVEARLRNRLGELPPRLRNSTHPTVLAYVAQATLEYEARVKDAGRIADALLTMTDAIRLAVEAQVSPISFENVQRRTNSYTGADVDVVWVFIAEEGNRLRPGSSWETARNWLIDEGYMVVIATLATEVIPLPLAR